MLAFIDESGHPHPSDRSTRPVVVAVCFQRDQARFISSRLYALKRDVVGKPDIELKGRDLLNPRTFRRIPAYKELVESFFDLLRGAFQVTIFAVIMERPKSPPPTDPDFLPNQYRYLLQRVDMLLRDTGGRTLVLVDGTGTQYNCLSTRFANFLFKSHEGRSLSNIVDTPYFVDSKFTSGIQVADMVASAIRQYEENKLFLEVPRGDAYLHAIQRYYDIARSRTVDLYTIDGFKRHGFYRMPERLHYRPAEEEAIGLEEESLQ